MKNLAAFLILSFFAASAQASIPGAGSPMIWGPGAAKSIPGTIDIGGNAKVITGTADPTVSAVNAPTGSMYLRTGTSGGATYLKQDAGSTTNWKRAAAGAAASQIIQARYVNKSGSDVACPASPCGDGSIDRPFLTVGAAQASISDATSAKIYGIFVGPGSFVESSGFVLQDWMYIVGSGVGLTTITRSGGTAIVWTPLNLTTGNKTYLYDVSLGSLTVTRNAAGVVTTNPSSLATLGVYRSSIGTFIYNGVGYLSQTGLDQTDIVDSSFGAVTLHSTGGSFLRSFTGTVLVDDTVLAGVVTTSSTVRGTGITGTWNGTTNTPALTNGVGANGDVYQVTVAGTQNFGAGNISFVVNDYVGYNGSVWSKTIPTQTALNYITGGGRLIIYDVQGGNVQASMGYTGYDSTTGLVTGVAYQNNFGFAVGSYITNEASGFGVFNECQTGRVTVRVVGGAKNASSCNVLGGPASGVTLDGALASILMNRAIGIAAQGNGLILTNSGTATRITRLAYTDGYGYTPTASGDWPTQPVSLTDGLDFLATTRVLRAGDTLSLTSPMTFDGSTDIVKTKVKGAAGQTNDLQEWLDSTSSILAKVDSAGNITGTNLSGTNTGNVTLAAVGAAPSANGASLSGQALTLQPADATHPGVVTSGTQSFGGDKTFITAGSKPGLSISTITGNLDVKIGDYTGINFGEYLDISDNDGSFTFYNGGVTVPSLASAGLISATSENLTGILDMGSHKITSVTDPASAQDAATKNYVDTVASGLNPKQAAYAASTVNIAGTYVNGVACVAATLTVTATGAFTIDGFTPPAGSRILLKDQTSGLQNGIYDLTLAGSMGVSPILTRSFDYDTAADVDAGDLIPVLNVTNSGGSQGTNTWLQTANVVNCGTDALAFSAWAYNPANFLRKDGSVALTSDWAVGSHKLTGLTDPSSAQDAATKNYADTTFLKKDGSTTLSADWAVGTHKITGVTDPGSAQDVATKNYVDTLPSLPVNGGQSFNPSLKTEWIDDFDSGGAAGSTGWSIANTADTGPLDSGHIGIARQTTGASSSQVSYLYKDSHFIYGGGTSTDEMMIQLSALSDGTNTYTYRVGCQDSLDGTASANGAWFSYTHSVNSGNWVANTANNSTVTSVNTASAVTAGAWIKLKILVNAAGTQADFFVNGSNVGTSVTNINTATNRRCLLTSLIVKSAGTTARFVYLDYWWHQLVWTTPR